MGTFQRIRQISPYFFGFFAVMLVLFFTIGDQTVVEGLFGSTNPQAQPIAVVNDEELAYGDYDYNVKQALEQQRLQQQQQGMNQEVDELQVRRQIWEQMIDELLLKQEAEKAGITITDEEIKNVMLNNPPDFLKQNFSDSAGFREDIYLSIVTNPENYVNYLGADPSQIPEETRREAVANLRKQLTMVEDFLRAQKMNENMQAIVNSAAGIISPTYARQKYINENATATVNYIALKVDPVGINNVSISEDKIKDYYNKHKSYYKQEAQAKLKYVSFPLVASAQDTATAQRKINIIQTELNKATSPEQKDSTFDVKMNEFGGSTSEFTLVKDIDQRKLYYLSNLQQGDIAGPVDLGDFVYFFRLDEKRSGEDEVVKASHILIKADGNKDSARTIANDLLKRARQGEDFAMLAREFSQDPGSGQRGGDLGYFGKGQMVPEFEQAAFNASEGQIVGPVESDFGFHIIKVDDKVSDEIKFSEIIISPNVSQFTKKNAQRAAYDFMRQIQEDKKNFDTLAKVLNLKPVETSFFEEEQPILGSNYLTDMAFEEEVGTALEPVELENYGLIVAKVVDKKSAGVASLEDVKPQIERRLAQKHILDSLKTVAEDIYSKIKNADILAKVGEFYPNIPVQTAEEVKNNGVIPGAGSDFGFTAAAFITPVGKISEPVRGENGYYIIQVTNKNIPDNNEVQQQLPDYISGLRQQNSAKGFYMWYDQVKRKASIEDRRRLYYREY